MDGRFLTHRTFRSDIEAVSACTRHSYPRHTHDQFGIGVIERGAHRSLSGRGVVEAVAGQAITVNPGEVHDGHPIGGASRAWSMFYFSPELARELTVEIAEGNNREYEFERPVIGDAEVARLFLMLFRNLTAPRKTLSEVLADQTLLLLFARIARPGEPIHERRAPTGVRIAQELIDDDPATPRSLDDLAAASGLGRFQVVRAFARHTGLTPHAYIVQRRLQLARRLISGGHALADAAAACGFSDQSHMTRLFRRTFGISPGAYSRSTGSMLLTLAISGYRSIRDLVLPLDRLNVITGPNGSGKSSLYRAIRLLADVAQGRIIGSLAHEGGLHSTLWAGPEKISRGMKTGDVPVQGAVRRDRISMKLGFADEDYGYAIDLGLPIPSIGSYFNNDPEIKTEAVWAGEYLKRSSSFATRNGPVISILSETGSREIVLKDLPPFDSMMTHAADPKAAPELLFLRERMRGWRFYDHFRTDPEAPPPRAQVGTRTPVLASDGADLAAAMRTIREIGDSTALSAAINNAFPGSSISVEVTDGLFEVIMTQQGVLRPLRTAELSDGTLRYLLLVAALLTPRPPSLLVLNEPETSLHPDLLPALAQLIAKASEKSQIIVVSHAMPLVDSLAAVNGSAVYTLKKELGETVIPDCETPAWAWPKR